MLKGKCVDNLVKDRVVVFVSNEVMMNVMGVLYFVFVVMVFSKIKMFVLIVVFKLYSVSRGSESVCLSFGVLVLLFNEEVVMESLLVRSVF